MARLKPIEYQGPQTEYLPPIGESMGVRTQKPVNTAGVGNGYSDIHYLLGLLDKLAAKVGTIYGEAQNQLQDFGLIIDSDLSDLSNAHKLVYPSDTPPSIISFEEYKYLQANNTSNASQYILTQYENALRGPNGNNALDISNIASYINNEINRIRGFIDGYVGEVDDSSEQRTVELLQDWTEDATAFIEKFWQALKGQITTRLPQSELDQLTQETAVQLQALLQVKLNKINQNIRDLLGQLIKNWEDPSDIFYDKHLGPALKFQLKVGRNIFDQANIKNMPTISNEIIGTMTGLNSNFSGILADQIRRNHLFSNSLTEILVNIAQRDTYWSHLKDLSAKGKMMPDQFTNTSHIDHPEAIKTISLDEVNSNYNRTVNFTDNFNPSHSELTDTEDILAHPQYLLRSGGIDSIITGDIEMSEDVRIGGIIPSKHAHTGSDGSSKISRDSLAENSITDNEVDNNTPSTSVPTDLMLISQVASIIPPGITKISSKVSFNVDTTNIVSYEFEVTKLPN